MSGQISLGPGSIILVVVWGVCILTCLVFSRSEGVGKYISLLCALIAVITTLVLWLYPRGEYVDQVRVVHDSSYVLRTAVVSVLGVMLFIGLIVVAIFHVFDQHRAAAIKPTYYY